MENDHLRILQAVNHLTSMNSMKLISRSGCTKVDDDIVKLILCKLVHLYGDMLMLNCYTVIIKRAQRVYCYAVDLYEGIKRLSGTYFLLACFKGQKHVGYLAILLSAQNNNMIFICRQVATELCFWHHVIT